MGKRDFSDLEDQIRDTVKSAFDAIDFAGIKRDINNATGNTINEVKNNFNYKSNYYNKKAKEKIKNKYRTVKKINTKDEKNKLRSYIPKRPAGSISGILYTVFGSIFTIVFGILLIVCSVFTSLWSGFSAINSISLGLLSLFFMASAGLTFAGTKLRKRVKRFKQYVCSLDSQSYCSIEELAVSINKKNKYVLKDLRKMIELGMFPQGHIDEERTYFMLSDETYENYLNSQEALKQRERDEIKKQEEIKQEENDPVKRELRRTIEIGIDYIGQIKDINEIIQKEVISDKLTKLQNIVEQILNYVQKNPNKLQEVNKFINHYLPMTLKLVNAYKELNDQPVQGENIKNAKNEIEKSIDIINIAFEKLLDDLFEEVALDISTDISVLKTLFTQEGLTKKDFEK